MPANLIPIARIIPEAADTKQGKAPTLQFRPRGAGRPEKIIRVIDATFDAESDRDENWTFSSHFPPGNPLPRLYSDALNRRESAEFAFGLTV